MTRSLPALVGGRLRAASALLGGRVAGQGRRLRAALRGRPRTGYPVEYEHPTQGIGSAFLRALAEDDPAGTWERLSRESRGLLEGLFAARAGMTLQECAAAGVEGDAERLRAMLAPLHAAALGALGGAARVNGFGVSAARRVDRQTAYVLLLPEFGDERIVAEDDWRPSHLLAFVHESGAPPGGSGVPPGGSADWLVDLGRTAELSAAAGLPDPLGAVR